MRKDDKYKKYFDKLAIDFYHTKQRANNNFFKFIGKKINASSVYCKSEYKKAQIRLYHKINKIHLISADTGIAVPELINLVFLGDLKLTNKGINSFKRILNASLSAKQKTLPKNINPFVNRQDALNINLTAFLEHLSRQLEYPKRQDGRINAKILDDGSVFYSNNAIYQALKSYYKAAFSQDIGTPANAKKYMIELVNRLRDINLLAKKVSYGYYSNSFTVKDGDGTVRREYGIFVKNVKN